MALQSQAVASPPYTHPLLSRFALLLEDSNFEDGVCRASERIVVATITQASATHLGHRIETTATLSVNRMIKNTGPKTTTIVANIPGGLLDGYMNSSSAANGVPVVGTRWAMVLRYGGDFNSIPFLIRLFPIRKRAALPSRKDLIAAYEEYCHE